MRTVAETAETLQAARNWDERYAENMGNGMCARCAARAAWIVQPQCRKDAEGFCCISRATAERETSTTETAQQSSRES